MRGRAWGVGAVGCVLALGLATAAIAAPGDIERVGVTSSGAGTSELFFGLEPDISDDGRYAVFSHVGTTPGGHLLPGEQDGESYIYRRDLQTDSTVHASLDSGGALPEPGVTVNLRPTISGDGNFVAWESNATTLVTGDSNGLFDVFTHNMTSGVTARASVDTGGMDANGASTHPSISGNGDDVAFESLADDMTGADSNGVNDVYIDPEFTTPFLVSDTTVGGVAGNDPSVDASISDSGAEAAFESTATDLAAEDTTADSDVYLAPGAPPDPVVVSVTSDEQPVDAFAASAEISGDGTKVVFVGAGPFAQPYGGLRAVFLRDLTAGTTERVDVTWDGSPTEPYAEGVLDTPTLSDDGRYVAFSAEAGNIVPNDLNNVRDVFVRDRLEGRTIRVSVRPNGVDGTGAAERRRSSLSPSISGDGSVVAFMSEDNLLVPNDLHDDAAGPEPFAVELDWIRPETSTFAPEPLAINPDQAAIGISANEVATFECRVDGGAYAPCTSPYVTPSLSDGQHVAEVRATDRFGNIEDTPAAVAFEIGQVPRPEFRKSFTIEVVSGAVFVTPPGGTRVRVQDLISIPQGSVVDARRGKARLTAETKSGKLESALWSQGVFKPVQLANGILECRLVGPLREAGAGAAAAGHGPRANAARKRRRLWGDGRGKFRTKGRYGSATVRGTKWLVEDRPKGTFFLVRRGRVVVRDFTRKRRVVLRKGQRYFAPKRARRARP